MTPLQNGIQRWDAVKVYARPSKIRRMLGNFGRLLTSEKQNMDVLSTFCGRKYGRLGVMQNPV